YHEAFLLDLRQEEAALFDALSRNRKRELKRWKLEECSIITDPSRLAKFFLETYHEFMHAHSAASVYDFQRATLATLLGLNDVILLGAGTGDQIEAVTVFAHSSTIGESFLAASVPGGEHHSAVLAWEGALELRRRGVATLNLGGGVRVGDGVAEFKQRFGAT